MVAIGHKFVLQAAGYAKERPVSALHLHSESRSDLQLPSGMAYMAYRSHCLDLGFPLCPPSFQSFSMKRKQCDDSQLQALRLKASEIIASAHESNGEGKAKYKKAGHAPNCTSPVIGWSSSASHVRKAYSPAQTLRRLQAPQVVKDFIDAGGATDDLIVRIGTHFFGCPVGKSSQGPLEDFRPRSE